MSEWKWIEAFKLFDLSVLSTSGACSFLTMEPSLSTMSLHLHSLAMPWTCSGSPVCLCTWSAFALLDLQPSAGTSRGLVCDFLTNNTQSVIPFGTGCTICIPFCYHLYHHVFSHIKPVLLMMMESLVTINSQKYDHFGFVLKQGLTNFLLSLKVKVT